MDSSSNIPEQLQALIDRELASDEEIIWIDMPIPHYFTKASTSMFLFAIPWTAFSIFWMCGAAGFEVPDFQEGFDLFPIFGLPFFFIGLGMLSAPIWTYKKAQKTVYAITNQRAITVEVGFSRTIRSYTPKDLKDVYRKEYGNLGDVIIKRETRKDSDGDQHIDELGFIRIQYAKEVEQMLKVLSKLDDHSDA